MPLTLKVKSQVKSQMKQEFLKTAFFTYSLCRFNSIIGTDIVSLLTNSQRSEKYTRITVLQISYVILRIEAPGVYQFFQFFEMTFIRGSVCCKS